VRNALVADLQHCDLRNSDLTGAQLDGADLSWATLDGATLEKAVFGRARLVETVLRGANLSGADLSQVTGLTWAAIHDVTGDETANWPAGFDRSRPRVADPLIHSPQGNAGWDEQPPMRVLTGRSSVDQGRDRCSVCRTRRLGSRPISGLSGFLGEPTSRSTRRGSRGRRRCPPG
jgi:hypothetical protein